MITVILKLKFINKYVFIIDDYFCKYNSYYI